MEMKPLAPVMVYSPHPLLAQAGRTVVTTPFLPGESIAGYLSRQGINLDARPVVLQLDGATVPRAYWHVVRPKPGRIITIRAAVHGGGSSGDNKTTNTVLTILVLIAAAYTGGEIGLAYGAGWGAVASLVVSYAGMRLVNQIAPLPLKEAEPEASPTYSLSNSGNSARLYQPLPLVAGTHLVFPDLGANYYTEFLGEDQYLFQVFNFGLSDLVLSEIKIGDTLITDYTGVSSQESGADGALTLFPGNVDQIAGGALTEAGDWVTRTSSLDATSLAVELSGFMYAFYNKSKDAAPLWTVFEIQYRAVGSGTWLIFSNEKFTTEPNPPDSIPPVYDVEGYTVIRTQGRSPLRLGYRRDVTPGQYEVRVRHVSSDAADWGINEEGTGYVFGPSNATIDSALLFFDVLRTYQPDTADYTGQKRLAVRIKASGQLNGRIDKLNAIAMARTLVWNGSTWSLGSTSNPAWWFLWAARGKTLLGRRAFGGGLADAAIDIEGIKAWGAWCDGKALTVNAVFDRPQSVLELLTVIARCGRAAVSWSSGKLGVIYDAADQPAVAVFGMANIRRGTFQVDYLTEDLADEIEVEFINPSLGWKPDVVRKAVPGATTSAERSVRIAFLGCTNESMAGREANLLAAAQQKRRRRVTWDTDVEGLVVNRGDVVILSHDLTQWGYSGRLVAGTTLQLTLDRKVPFTVGQNHYLGVRFPDGTYSVHDVVYAAGEHDVINLNPADPLAAAPDADINHPPLDYLWFFEPEPTPGKKVKIVSALPLDAYSVRLTAVDEDPDYYLAEFDAYTYVPPTTVGVALPALTRLQATDTLVQSGNGFSVIVKVAWDVEGEYGGAFVRIARKGEPLQDMASVLGRRYEFPAPPSGEWTIEVTAFNLLGRYGNQSRSTLNYTILGQDRDPADVTGFVALQNGPAVVMRWDAIGDVDLEGYFVRYGPRATSNWDDATPLTEADSGTTMTSMGVPPGDYDFFIKAKDWSKHYSLNAGQASLVVTSDFDAIFQDQQAPDWLGTRTNFVKHWTGVLVPESQDLANAQDDQSLFDNFVINPYATCVYEAPEYDLGFDGAIRAWGDIVSALGPGETTGVADPKLQIDYRTATGAYTGWKDWGVGQIFARHMKFRLVLDPAAGRAKVTGFLPTADALEFTQREQNLTVAIGGTAVVFDQPFHVVPSIRVWVSNGAALIAAFTGPSATGFTAKVFNGAGTDVGGVVNWEAVGI